MPTTEKKRGAKKEARRKPTVVVQDSRRRIDILYAWVFACARDRLTLSEPKNIGPSPMPEGASAGLTPYAACAMVAYWPGFRVDAEDQGPNSKWTFTMLDPGLRKGPSIEATVMQQFQDFEDYVVRGEAHYAASGDLGHFRNVIHRIQVRGKAFEEAAVKDAEARKLAEQRAIKRAGAGRDSLQHRAELLVRHGKQFETIRDSAGYHARAVPSSREAAMRLLRKATTFVKNILNYGPAETNGWVSWGVILSFVDNAEREVSVMFNAPPIESLLEPQILDEAAAKPVAPRKTLGERTDTL